MKPIFSILFGLVLSVASAQDKPAYRIFDQNGKEVSYAQMLKNSKKSDVVFFGEQHNNPISHWLQIELAKDLEKENNGKLIMGAEMFERDNQAILTEYLNGQISTKNFEEEARIWDNYATDYKPLVELAKSKKLPFIATNVPRRYANMVYKQGIESLNPLSGEAKAWIAPLPIEVDMNLPSYVSMAKMMGGHGGDAATTNLVKSQAVKDATMGYSIAQNLKKGYIFLHFNGAYHSDLKEGTVWYLRKYASVKDILTISTVEQDNIDKLDDENRNKADFIICVPANMTKTY
jgi:uncharacterized iron-regulated protein